MKQAIPFLCVLILGLNLPCSADDDVWGWVARVSDDVWSRLAKPFAFEDGIDPYTHSWQAVVRARDGWGPTSSVVFRKSLDGQACVSYVRTLGDNLNQQLADLRTKYPSITSRQAEGRLSYSTGQACSPSCKDLPRLARNLERLETSAMPEGTVRLHEPSFEVSITTASRSEREYRLAQDDGELAEWSRDLLSTIERCSDELSEQLRRDAH